MFVCFHVLKNRCRCLCCPVCNKSQEEPKKEEHGTRDIVVKKEEPKKEEPHKPKEMSSCDHSHTGYGPFDRYSLIYVVCLFVLMF